MAIRVPVWMSMSSCGAWWLRWHRKISMSGPIGVCDCNSFYVSCERVIDLSLAMSRLIVLSNNDGCAIAMSSEAKALGIRWAIRSISSRIRSKHTASLSGHRTTRCMPICTAGARGNRCVCQRHRDYLIDETFLDFGGFEHLDLIGVATKLRQRILQSTTVPTCVGIGPTKTFAKLGNAAAKKNPMFDGVADMSDQAIRDYVMTRFATKDIWGCGGATQRKLGDLGITTAAQLRDMPMRQARGIGTVVLERLVAELNGVPADVVEVIEPQRKGMAVTRSFGTPVTTLDGLMGAVAQYAMRAGEKLREHGLVAARMMVFFHTNKHQPDRPQYAARRSLNLHPMTQDSLELIAAARRGVEQVYRDGYGYTKAGIMLEHLTPATNRPRTLFEDHNALERRERLHGRTGQCQRQIWPHDRRASRARF